MPRPVYHGLVEKLVLAFDLGTTFSGASYAILEPDIIPEIQGVTRFPAHKAGGNAKIPTILWYDQQGQVKSIGAEALEPNTLEIAESEGWVQVKWFKLLLCPPDMKPADLKDDAIPKLPLGKTVVDICADMLHYLFKYTKEFIELKWPGGSDRWTSLVGHAEIILSHPNGWEGSQQKQMRIAAIRAGLVPDTAEGRDRIHFVTEGEASLHYCINRASSNDRIMSGNGVVVVDAGGGTIDVSAYQKKGDGKFDGIAPPQSRVQGSVCITNRVSPFLKEKLKNSKFGAENVIKAMIDKFDLETKIAFRDEKDPAYIKFGCPLDKDFAVGIRNGQMKLRGEDVAGFFEPSIQAIIDMIEEQLRVAHTPISDVLLVGGFAASDWLSSRLQKYAQDKGLSFCRPDGHVNKAVTDGAVSFFIDHFVSVRVARATYGTDCSTSFNFFDASHLRRIDKMGKSISGDIVLPNAFAKILTKGTRVSESQEFSAPFTISRRSQAGFGDLRSDIIKYVGKENDPQWVDEEPAMFITLCTIVADMSVCAKGLKPRIRNDGIPVFTAVIQVVMLFGLTELKAQLSWMENGVEKRSPATIIYDDEAERV